MFRFPHRPAVALLSRSALRYNWKIIRERLDRQTALHGKSTQVMAVVKADAYGHQMNVFAPEVARLGVKNFCVASLEEAVELRKVLPRAEILVLGGTLHWTRSSLELVKKHQLIIGVNDIESLKVLVEKPQIPIHLKFDTGMNRLGLKASEWEYAVSILKKKSRSLDGYYTHFASFEGSSFVRQARLFEEVVRWMDQQKIKARWIHCENSAALFAGPPIRKGILSEKVNLARPGISLYGYLPQNFKKKHSLHPVLELSAEISLIKNVEVGEGISYDHLYRAKKRHQYAIVPLGYADGIAKEYSRELEPLWYDMHGRKKGRLKICGAISMDMVMLRAESKKLQIHDRVSFWGNFPNPLLKKKAVDPYELNLRITKRIPRVWVS